MAEIGDIFALFFGELKTPQFILFTWPLYDLGLLSTFRFSFSASEIFILVFKRLRYVIQMGIQYCEYIRELKYICKYITGRHRPNHQRPILVFTQPDSVNKPVTCIEVYSTYANVFNVGIQWDEIISELSFWFLFTYTQAKNVWSGWFLAWKHNNHKNIDQSLLPKKLSLVFMGMKYFFFLNLKIFQNGWLKKTDFQNCQFSIFFLKNFRLVLELIESIDSKGIVFCPTYMVSRLSNVRWTYRKKCIFSVFSSKFLLHRTAWWLNRLSRIHALCISWSFPPKNQSLKYWELAVLKIFFG